ncbi:MAG TPA: hypothetical protein VK079_00170, partial [Bacillota bacterium]|nr:hypothetical protein [Bacillota bacterium]
KTLVNFQPIFMGGEMNYIVDLGAYFIFAGLILTKLHKAGMHFAFARLVSHKSQKVGIHRNLTIYFM